jgi:hypothetical protein
MMPVPPPGDGVELCGFAVGAAAWAEVCRLAADLAADPGRVYPWEGLEGELERAGRPLSLVGYGSLMSAASAAQTLRATPGGPRLVVAFGARRVFNYAMSESTLARYGPLADPLARAALNAYRSANPADAVNGVCLEVVAADVPALRRRERGYDLQPVVCLRWDRPAGPPFVAHVLSAPDRPADGERHTDDRLRPHAEYYRLCRDAAAAVSEAFLTFFLETTYLADRRTTARAWERSGRSG